MGAKGSEKEAGANHRGAAASWMPGKGLAKNSVDMTIKCIARLANDGMEKTN
jgi:hypothetical protein